MGRIKKAGSPATGQALLNGMIHASTDFLIRNRPDSSWDNIIAILHHHNT
jgi:hypothetical protein